MGNGHWICESEFETSDYFGFVYLITNLENNRKYIGKKQFIKKRRKKIKGRKNRKVILSESNWTEYTSSSNELNEDIKKLGKEKFEFRILKLCKTKRELGYSEVEEQFKRNVLKATLENGEREYYNQSIMSRWFANGSKGSLGKHWNLSEETKQKMSIARKGIPGYFKDKKRLDHSILMKLRVPIGTTFYDCSGIPKSLEQRKKMSDSHKLKDHSHLRVKKLCPHCNREFDLGNYTKHLKQLGIKDK